MMMMMIIIIIFIFKSIYRSHKCVSSFQRLVVASQFTNNYFALKEVESLSTYPKPFIHNVQILISFFENFRFVCTVLEKHHPSE